ncbi:MAG: hypothetical protein OEY96_12650 [Gammaproteobacteria bacterium]|nr:hypothetical protein [Gammaproteobacteria bacterium]
MSKQKTLKIFLPDLTIQQLTELKLLDVDSNKLAIEKMPDDWQSLFCDVIGYPQNDLPWTYLKAEQLELPKSMKTAVCCDPVMMQMTHQGAYMLGQAPLDLTTEQALIMLSQINDRLMEDGEALYQIDKLSWLYVTEKTLELESAPIQKLVGKDMFNFAYGGKDKSYWDRLGMEIQMLIKELSDYQKLIDLPEESLMNVHFSDCQTLPFNTTSNLKKSNWELYSENSMIESFGQIQNLKVSRVDELSQSLSSDKNQLIILFSDDSPYYQTAINHWLDFCKNRKHQAEIICYDGIVKSKSEQSLLKRMFGIK